MTIPVLVLLGALLVLVPAVSLLSARRREAKARTIIRAELAKLTEYERGHIGRQEQRISEQAKKRGHAHQNLRPHGAYDPDQRRQHVEILLRQQMKRPPENLAAILREEIPDEE